MPTRRNSTGRTLRSPANTSGGFGFLPLNVPGCVLWLRSDMKVTYVMGAVVATGTTPPAVTLTGTPNASAINKTSATPSIEIDITLGGTLGTAQFTWKLNGVVKQTGQLTAATFVLDATGLTANFPAGTYTADNVYKSNTQVSSWTDSSPSGFSFTQATASQQPVYSLTDGPLSSAALTFVNASAQRLSVSSNVVSITNCSIFIVHKFTALAGGSLFRSVFYVGPNGGGIDIRQTSTGSRDIVYPNVAAHTDAAATTNFETWTVTAGGAAPLLRVNGTSQSLSGGSTAPVTTGVAISTIGCDNAPAAANFLDGMICEIITYNSVLSAQQIATVEAYLRHRYGTW